MCVIHVSRRSPSDSRRCPVTGVLGCKAMRGCSVHGLCSAIVESSAVVGDISQSPCVWCMADNHKLCFDSLDAACSSSAAVRLQPLQFLLCTRSPSMRPEPACSITVYHVVVAMVGGTQLAGGTNVKEPQPTLPLVDNDVLQWTTTQLLQPTTAAAHLHICLGFCKFHMYACVPEWCTTAALIQCMCAAQTNAGNTFPSFACCCEPEALSALGKSPV